MNFILENMHFITTIWFGTYIIIASFLFCKIMKLIKNLDTTFVMNWKDCCERIKNIQGLFFDVQKGNATLERSVFHLEKQVKELQEKNKVQVKTKRGPSMSSIIMETLDRNPDGCMLEEIRQAVEKVKGYALANSVRSSLFYMEQLER